MVNTGNSEEEKQIALFSKAMSHPTRVEILNFLVSLDTCYFGDIHKELSISKSTVSQHLTELKKAGLIQGEIEYPKVKYCICKENWKVAKKLFEKFFNQGCDEKSNCQQS
jgi:ArsR family transcriptional regulator, arsenate/arsenite/antimonite-responsive transcriptional repressor